MARNTAFVWLYIYQNDVRTDPPDAVPWDDIVLFVPQKSEKTAGSGNNDGEDMSIRQIDAGIGDISQPLSVTDTDDLFAV